MNGAPPMNTRFIGLVSSISSVFGVAVADFRIRLADIKYFSPLLSASLLMPWYAGHTSGMASEISIDFFDFFDF